MSHIALAVQVGEGLAARQAAPGEGRQAEPPGAAGEGRPTGVLVIDDEELTLRGLKRGLSLRGFAVWCATDGAGGVDLYRRHGAQIDVVLSDLNMPVMDGPQTLDALRGINPFVRFCFMTADGRMSTLAALLQLGALRVFTKPFPSVGKIAEELRELAARAPAVLVPVEAPHEPDRPAENMAPAEGAEVGGLFGWVVSLFTRLA